MTDQKKRARVPGLDGIRAVAAILVLVYHLIPGWASNGFVGVDMFFVLSGFLITSLLVSAAQHHRFSLANFWVRRFRRLVPAVTVATLGSAALALLVGGDALVALGRQVLGSLTATYNWVEIGHGASYFEQASPLLLTNMWSLAVEQQFYLIWPLIVLLLLKAPRLVQVGVSLTFAAASTTWHAMLVDDNMSRAYMGTDTHLWGLMFGSALAFVLGGVLVPAHIQKKAVRTAWGIGAWASIALIIALLFAPESFMYPWGMVIISAAMIPILRAMVPDVSRASGPVRPLVALLETGPMTWLGDRSYGIYLWHWPLMVLLYYSNPLLPVPIAAAIVTVTAIIFAHLSYTYIETPIRTMGFGGWLRHITRVIGNANPVKAITATVVPLLVLVCAGWAIAIAPAVSSAEEAVNAGREHITPVEPPATPAPSDKAPTPSAEPTPTDTPSPDPATPTESAAPSGSPSAEPTPSEEPSPSEEPVAPAVTGDEVTIIGDSVTVAATPYLQQALPGVTINAEESRSARVAAQIISSMEANGQLKKYVVVALATNGAIREVDTEEILAAIGPDRTLIYVTGYGPARTTWIPESNAEIERAASAYPNVVVADWHHAIENHVDLLAGDAVHPHGAAAGEIYAHTIVDALNK